MKNNEFNIYGPHVVSRKLQDILVEHDNPGLTKRVGRLYNNTRKLLNTIDNLDDPQERIYLVEVVIADAFKKIDQYNFPEVVTTHFKCVLTADKRNVLDTATRIIVRKRKEVQRRANKLKDKKRKIKFLVGDALEIKDEKIYFWPTMYHKTVAKNLLAANLQGTTYQELCDIVELVCDIPVDKIRTIPVGITLEELKQGQ